MNFSLPSMKTSSNRVPIRTEEANALIAEMENDFFLSFGVTNEQVRKELDMMQGISEKQESMTERTGSSADIEEAEDEVDSSDVKLSKAESVPIMESDFKVSKLESKESFTKEEMDKRCHCDQMKNTRISDMYRKCDAFKEIGDVRMNMWNIRKRQYEFQLGPRLKEVLKRTVLPDTIQPEKVKEIQEDSVWLSDTDRLLLRLAHKPPLDKLRHLNNCPVEKAQAYEENEDDEAAINEKVDYVLKSAIKKADAVFTLALQDHIKKLKKSEERKYLNRLKYELDNQKERLNEEAVRKMAKLREDLRLQNEERIKVLKESMECEISNAVKLKEKDIRELHSFNAQMTSIDNDEKSRDRLRLFHRKCNEWLKKLKAQMKKDEKLKGLLSNTAYTKHTFSLLEKMKRQQRGHIAKMDRKHVNVEKSLMTLLVNTMCELEESKRTNTRLSKEKTGAIELVKELMQEYQKFINYVLKEEPGQGEYLLSFQRMFQLQMDQESCSKDQESNEESEEDINELLLSKLKMKLNERVCSEKSSSDDDAVPHKRADIGESEIKLKTVKDVIKDALFKAMPTPYDSEVELGQKLATKKPEVKGIVECTCDTDEADLSEFAESEEEEEQIPQGISFVGRYISALDVATDSRQVQYHQHQCDENEMERKIHKAIKKAGKGDEKIHKNPTLEKPVKQEKSRKSQKTQKLEPNVMADKERKTEVWISSKKSPSQDLNIDQFKHKRVKTMVEVLKSHPELMKKFINS